MKENSNIKTLDALSIDMVDRYISLRQNKENEINVNFYNKLSRISETDFYTNRIYNDRSIFDIFLAHTSKDKVMIKKLYFYLEVICGLRVYVDWICDPFLNRTNVTKKSVRLIEIRLRQSKSIILCKTVKFRSSRWVMWEIGYFGGYKNANMGQINLGMANIAKLEFLLSCKNVELINQNLYLIEKGSTITWIDWINR